MKMMIYKYTYIYIYIVQSHEDWRKWTNNNNPIIFLGILNPCKPINSLGLCTIL